MYNRLPMGYSDASDQFLIASDPLVRGIPRVSKSIDDIIGQHRTFNKLAAALKEILTRAINNKFTFSISKFKISNNLTFGGFQVMASKRGEVTVEPDENRISALHNMPQPTTKKELHRFLEWLMCSDLGSGR